MSSSRLRPVGRALALCLALGTFLNAVHARPPQGDDNEYRRPGHHGHGHENGRPEGPPGPPPHAMSGPGPAPVYRSAPPPAMARPGGVSVQVQIGGYFDDGQRRSAHDYYEPRWREGRCPPGLMRHGHRCEPPGHARHWQRGEPLPRGVAYYPVPASVQVRLGPPPQGYRFVRVATDILLIAVGTGLVVDAIEDLGGQ